VAGWSAPCAAGTGTACCTWAGWWWRPTGRGRGIGSRLLTAVEGTTSLPRGTLFTGGRSTANQRRYRRHGYVEGSREALRPGLELVHLVKDLA
jgi:hypothetical protein